MNDYVKFMSQKTDGGNGERQLSIGALGSAMVAHGEDFELDSRFGQCLVIMGRTSERLARLQDAYVQKATLTWLDSLEHSRAQHKELGQSRKKLGDRRLAFDTASAKIEKTKKEDFRAEEELRSQRAKYEEANEDVYRRMMDIKEMEADSVADLTAFLDCQIAYFERCKDALLQAKREWPGVYDLGSPTDKSRSNTSSPPNVDTTGERSFTPPSLPSRPNIGGGRLLSNSLPQSPSKETSGFDLSSRPGVNRSATDNGLKRDISQALPLHTGRRMVSDNLSIRTQRSQLRSVSPICNKEYSASPISLNGGEIGNPGHGDGTISVKKRPPPPPPSRASKPPLSLAPVR